MITLRIPPVIYSIKSFLNVQQQTFASLFHSVSTLNLSTPIFRLCIPTNSVWFLLIPHKCNISPWQQTSHLIFNCRKVRTCVTCLSNDDPGASSSTFKQWQGGVRGEISSLISFC